MRLLSSSSVHLPPSGSRTTQELGAECVCGGGDTRLGAPPAGGTASSTQGSPENARPAALRQVTLGLQPQESLLPGLCRPLRPCPASER